MSTGVSQTDEDELLVPLDPELDGFALISRDMRRASEAVEVVERFYAVGPHVARLRFAGDALVEPLTRAIRHLEHDVVQEPELTIHVWDSVTTGVPLSPLLQVLVDSFHGNPFAALSPRHEIAAMTTDRVGATFELGSGVLTLFDRRRGEAVYWVRRPEELPYYELGAPFRTTLNWWLSEHGVQCIHAAAIGTEDGAVLLTGRGGSGKSTAALASIAGTLGYIGDDYCAFSTADGPEVFSLYNTGKLRGDDDLERLPHFVPWIVNPDRSGDEKFLLYLAEHVPERIVRRAPLRAIVMPRVTGADEPQLAPVSPAAALRALAPTSMLQLPGSHAGAMLQMAALVRSVPCFALECGSVPATTRLLEELVADLTG